MGKLIPEIVKRFDLEYVNPAGLETENVWFVKQKNFNYKIAARSFEK
jgi:hypothetical protein